MANNSTSTKRVVITGIGLMSPIGIGREAFVESLRTGKSGVHTVSGYAAPAAGAVEEFTEDIARKTWLKAQRKNVKVMSRDVQLGVAGALVASEDAGLTTESVPRNRIGVEFGANLMLTPPGDFSEPAVACANQQGSFDYNNWGTTGLSKMEPLWMLKYLPNMPACHVGIATDSQGPNNSITQDEVSGLLALGEAAAILRRGTVDVMIAGATGNTLHATKAIYNRFGWRYSDAKEPVAEKSVKPFDRNRHGCTIAEAGCGIILEEESFAKGRGATILGTVLGCGSSCVAEPGGKANIRLAVANAMRAALRQSGLSPADIGHVNAHGFGTIDGDQSEAEAIHDVFGERGESIPVVALKGFLGNPGAAGGLLELAASVLLLQDGEIPYTINCDNPDPECRLNIVTGSPQRIDNRVVMNISYTLIGQASACIVGC